jgi:hypothetical protein
LATLSGCASFLLQSPAAVRTCTGLHRTQPQVSMKCTVWQPEALSKVVSTLGLTEKADYAADHGYEDNVQCYEGPGAPNVAWCSGLLLPGERSPQKEEGTLSALTVFCGPLTDVPHLVCSAGVSNDGIDLYIDFRPRADAAYDPQFESLDDYPEPTDRNMFAQTSARKDFASAFYTEDAVEARAALLALGTPTEDPLTAEAAAAISAGPLLVDMRLPLTDKNAAAASDACAAAVDRWLGWMTGAAEMGRELPAGAKQTATYTRDTKVRANHFGFLLGRYTKLYGVEEGKALATADAGPLDEAYVGGGS